MTSRFALLTAPGTAAIASIALWGPDVWAIVRKHFQPASGKALPEQPSAGLTWFGRVGADMRDEVILVAVQSQPVLSLEIHCHGGRVVQQMMLDLFEADGLQLVDSALWFGEVGYASEPLSDHSATAWRMLPDAPTQRTASILLDQTKLDRIEPSSERFEALGGHLTKPWKVAIVGSPNVGKSSLINALAGFQRSVVAPIPGTTRDLVTVQIALDGWPIELTDTAGLRETTDDIESEGIRRAKDAIDASDLVLWMTDSESWKSARLNEVPPSALRIVNKIDLSDNLNWVDWIPISVAKGKGIPELIQTIVRKLVPETPQPGDGVPIVP